MKNTSRIISMLLTFAMLISVVACAESADEKENSLTADEDAVIETEPEETDRTQYKDNLPEDLHFEGDTYRILVRGDYFDVEFFVEEDSADVVDSAVYNRNKYIEDKYDVKYEAICRGESANYNAELKNIRTDISSADDAYEIIAGYSVHVAPLFTEGLFMDLNSINYLDFSMPWWPDSIVNEMQIAGKLFYITGDIAYTSLSKAMCFYFNKKTAEQYNIEDIYSIVNSGDWTWDRYMSITSDIYDDLNGNGKQDDDDFYGTAITAYNNVDALMAAFDVKVTTMDEEGYPVIALSGDRMVKLVERAYDIIWETYGAHCPRNSLEDMATVYKIFKGDRAIFMMWELTACDQLRDMDSDFGIIPYPKFDENQNHYGSYVQDGHSLLCVPTTNQHLDLTGAMTEALAGESYRKLTPAYFEVALQVKYSRDNESVAMLELVRDSVSYNFGYVSLLDAFFTTRTLMNQGSKGSNNFASYYEKNQKSWNRKLEKMIDTFNDNSAN